MKAKATTHSTLTLGANATAPIPGLARTGGRFSVAWVAAALAATLFFQAPAAPAAPLKSLRGHVPAAVAHLQPLGRLSATNPLRLAIGLPLRDPVGLDAFLAQLYDPASPNYRHFLTPAEFTERFGPTEADYEAVKQFARTNGLAIAATCADRLLLDVAGPAAAVENAFHISLLTYQHPTEARRCFAPDAEPTVDASLPVADIEGLSDFYRPHPNIRKMSLANFHPNSGSAPDGSGSYFSDDFRNAYAPGVALTGAGQSVGLFEFDGFYSNDVATYAQAAGDGRTNIVIQTVLLDGESGTPGFSGIPNGNLEVSLDIEMAMAMAPGLTEIVVFEGDFQNDILHSMLASSSSVKQLSCSWYWGYGPSSTTDHIFEAMQAVGQSFFDASGDTEGDPPGIADQNAPSSNPYITLVGGTKLTMSGTGAAYTSETVWNSGGSGSSGGVSSYYAIPSWQTSVRDMASRGGSASYRNIPDVALTADNVYVDVENGQYGAADGTSCAAPLWAGFTALINQQTAMNGQPSVGFINPAVYAIAAGSAYATCFHDITVGNNKLFQAQPGYDLCTGLGTPSAGLISALAGAYNPVVSNTNDSGFGSLRQAILYATNGTTITFAKTLSGQTITLASDQLTLSNNLIIDGSALKKGIQLNGNGSFRLFDVNAGVTVTLNSLTLTNGDAGTVNGGAIRNAGDLTLTDCTLSGNTATSGRGAGIYNNGGTLTLDECTLAGNAASAPGGAIFNDPNGTASLNSCTLSGNSAGTGGGINNNGTLTVTNSIVAGNTQSSGADINGAFTGQNNLTSGNPLLAPLGNYGGPTQTMLPLPGSPAIDAGLDSVTNQFATDQRGFPRLSGAHVDIGAAELALNSPVVLNTTDSEYGSLRYILTYLPAGSMITFDPSLSGQTITLTSGKLLLTNSVTIDASALPGGITLDGNDSFRPFDINAGATVTLNSLTVVNGAAGVGGGIRDNGILTLDSCTLSGNASTNGNGGGLYVNSGTVTLNECTLSGNAASGNGGGIAIAPGGTAFVNSCTVSGNSGGAGGGINNNGTLTLTNSIVAGNTQSSGTDINGAFTGQNNLTSGNPLLAPLGNYGGPTQTMLPLPGSTAIDAGLDSVTNQFATDSKLLSS